MTDAPQPDLKTLIRRLEARHRRRQAGVALLAGTAVLAAVVFVPQAFKANSPEPITAATGVAPLPAGPDAYAGVAIEGKAAVVYDLATRQVLFSKNDRSQLPLASLTKLITMYAASDALSPDTEITMTDDALAQDGDSGLARGETFAFKDLGRLALVASSNDAAAAIADAAAQKRSVSNKDLLASAVAAVGLAQTYALNGTGLDVSTSISGGYGSAYDVAELSGALLAKNPAVAHATIEPSVTITSAAGVVHTLPNTNQDVVHLPNLLLSKTGYTDLAGGNLSIIYDAGIGHPVAIVVLGSSREGRFTDVETLLSRTEAHFAGIAPSGTH